MSRGADIDTRIRNAETYTVPKIILKKMAKNLYNSQNTRKFASQTHIAQAQVAEW